MDTKEYTKLSASTCNTNYDEVGGRVDDEMIDLLHASIGLTTESSEIADALKKTLFYGKPLDRVNLLEELGDLMWYQALMIRRLGGDFEAIMDTNIAKLKARYPQGFTEEAALNRKLDDERKILEDGANG